MLSARLGIIVLTCALASDAWAQEHTAQAATPDQAELDQALLDEERNRETRIASGLEESRALAPANVTTVTYDTIAQRGYRSLADLLRDVVGLYVIDDHVLPALSVRGVSGGVRAGTRIVRIMINGVVVNFRPDLTAFIGPEFIPLAMVERVEIALGPLSALYGANAFLATINVITRGQAGGALVAEGTVRVHLNGANLGYGGTVVGGYEEKAHSLLVSVGADRFDRSGLVVEPTFSTQDKTRPTYSAFLGGSSVGDVAQPLSVYAQYAAWDDALGRLTFQGGIQHLDSMAEFQLASVLTHRSRVALENDFASLRYEKSFGSAVVLDATVAWSRGLPLPEERLYLTGTSQSYYTRNFRSSTLDGQFNLAFTPVETVALSFKTGVDFSYDWQNALSFTEVVLAPSAGSGMASGTRIPPVFPKEDPATFSMSDVGVPLQITLSPGKTGPLSKLRLTLNGRLDFFNYFPMQYSWRAAVAWAPDEQFSLKLVGGRAFQAPSGVMLFAQPDFGTAGNVSGNLIRTNQRLETPRLRPQVVHSVELIASTQLVRRLGIEASIFGQIVDDLIQFARAGADFKAVNQGRMGSAGLEFSVNFALGRLTLFGIGSFQRTLLAENPAAIIQADRPDLSLAPASFPNAQGVVGLNVAVPEAFLNANARLRAVGPRGATQSNALLNNGAYELPGYVHVDLTVSTAGLNFLGGSQTALAFTVRNLLDVRAPEPAFGGFDIPGAGRTMMLELKQSY